MWHIIYALSLTFSIGFPGVAPDCCGNWTAGKKIISTSRHLDRAILLLAYPDALWILYTAGRKICIFLGLIPCFVSTDGVLGLGATIVQKVANWCPSLWEWNYPKGIWMIRQPTTSCSAVKMGTCCSATHMNGGSLAHGVKPARVGYAGYRQE